MLYSFLFLALIFIGFKIIISNQNKYYWILCILSLLISLLRFEGILISSGMILLIFIYHYIKEKSLKINKSHLFPLFIVYLIPLMIYMIFRYYYFHEVFPLPFFVKTLTLTSSIWFIKSYSSWIRSLEYITPFILVIFLGILSIIKNRINQVDNFKLIILLIMAGVTLIFGNIIYLPTSLIMNYADRFFYPSYVLIYFICGVF